ncbi:hypothetical protein CLU79DRAFT_368041 [Phycomyces nitens]|nr:hypothetical protein CLU79DRAFT_368041 [Phycomyces nitens]
MTSDTSQISVHVNLEETLNQTRVVSSQSIALYPTSSGSHDIRVRVIENEDESEDDPKTVLNSRVFYCHKEILANTSPLFKTMISHISDTPNSRDIIIRSVRPDVFEKLFTYMYTSKCIVKNVMEASEVIKASKRLQFRSIRPYVFYYLRKRLTAENIWIIWDLAVNYGCEQAVISCEDFVRKEAKNLLSNQGWHDLDQESISKMICLYGLPLNITKTLLHTSLLSWRTSTLNCLMAESSESNGPDAQRTSVSDTQRYFRELKRYPESEEEVEKAFFEMTQLICSSHVSIHRMRKQTRRNTRAMQPPSSRKIIFKPMQFKNGSFKKSRNS